MTNEKSSRVSGVVVSVAYVFLAQPVVSKVREAKQWRFGQGAERVMEGQKIYEAFTEESAPGLYQGFLASLFVSFCVFVLFCIGML